MKVCNSSNGGHYTIPAVNCNIIAIMSGAVKISIFLYQFRKIFGVDRSGFERNTIHNTEIIILFVKCSTALFAIQNTGTWRYFVFHSLHLPLPRYNLINQTFLVTFQFFYQLLFLCNQPVNLSALGVKIVGDFFLFCARWNSNNNI